MPATNPNPNEVWLSFADNPTITPKFTLFLNRLLKITDAEFAAQVETLANLRSDALLEIFTEKDLQWFGQPMPFIYRRLLLSSAMPAIVDNKDVYNRLKRLQTIDPGASQLAQLLFASQSAMLAEPFAKFEVLYHCKSSEFYGFSEDVQASLSKKLIEKYQAAFIQAIEKAAKKMTVEAFFQYFSARCLNMNSLIKSLQLLSRPNTHGQTLLQRVAEKLQASTALSPYYFIFLFNLPEGFTAYNATYAEQGSLVHKLSGLVVTSPCFKAMVDKIDRQSYKTDPKSFLQATDDNGLTPLQILLDSVNEAVSPADLLNAVECGATFIQLGAKPGVVSQGRKINWLHLLLDLLNTDKAWHAKGIVRTLQIYNADFTGLTSAFSRNEKSIGERIHTASSIGKVAKVELICLLQQLGVSIPNNQTSILALADSYDAFSRPKGGVSDNAHRYAKFINLDETPLYNATQLLQNYIQPLNQYFSSPKSCYAPLRFFTGHINRNALKLTAVESALTEHHESVEKLLVSVCKHLYAQSTSGGDVGKMMYNKLKVTEPTSSLYRRLSFLCSLYLPKTNVCALLHQGKQAYNEEHGITAQPDCFVQ